MLNAVFGSRRCLRAAIISAPLLQHDYSGNEIIQLVYNLLSKSREFEPEGTLAERFLRASLGAA